MSVENELQTRSESKCELCSAEHWAQDLLEQLYLDEETQTWAEAGIEIEGRVNGQQIVILTKYVKKSN
jgi:uncharacterized Zn ribbon protein